MERCTHDVESHNRPGEALALLDAQSRRLMELWLKGLDRKQIASELGVCEEAAAAIFDTAIRQLQTLLCRS
jgi:DNA-binding NarL/FixJ family response regulator